MCGVGGNDCTAFDFMSTQMYLFLKCRYEHAQMYFRSMHTPTYTHIHNHTLVCTQVHTHTHTDTDTHAHK